MQHYITWADFCLPLKAYRFELPPPNESVSHLADLRHGQQEYERERLAYSKALAQVYRGETSERPPDWRLQVRDKLALIRIWENPEVPPTEATGYARPALYDPLLLYTELFDAPRLIQAVHSTVSAGADIAARRQLQAVLLSFWQAEFKSKALAQPLLPTGVQSVPDWQKATKYFEYSVELVSKWLLLHYEMFPLFWGPLVAQYAELTPEWEQYIQQAERQAAIQAGTLRPWIPRLKG